MDLITLEKVEERDEPPQPGAPVEIEIRGPNGGVMVFRGCILVKMERDYNGAARIVVNSEVMLFEPAKEDFRYGSDGRADTGRGRGSW